MSLSQRLAALLGVDAASSEDQLVDRITALHQSQSATTALQSSLTNIGTALGVAEGAKPEAIVAAAQAARKTDTDLVPALQAQVTSLQRSLDTIATDRAREKATAFVDAAKAEGRVGVTQANRDEFISMHMANPATAEKLINGFPKIAPGALPTQTAPTELALQSVEDISAKARKHQMEQKVAGRDLSWSEAVLAVSGDAQ